MSVDFNKILLLLILACFLSPLILFAQEAENLNRINESDSTVIDSKFMETSSEIIQKSAEAESPNSITGELNQSSITQRNIVLKYGYIERLLKPWVSFTEKLKGKNGFGYWYFLFPSISAFIKSYQCSK